MVAEPVPVRVRTDKGRVARRATRRGENGDKGQPAAGNAETGIFKTDEEQKRDRRNEDIHAKKGANAVGEKLLEEEREIQPVCGDPREKLPVRENDPERQSRR